MHWYWHWLSSLGDVVRMLPLFACALLLMAGQSPAGRVAAHRWLTATCVSGILVAASKIGFYGWGTGVKAWNLAMPSGHATMAMALWPVLLTVLIPVDRHIWRRLATATGIVLGIACAWSRVALRAHPPSEAAAGIAMGLVVMAIALPPIQTLRLIVPRSVIVASGLLVLLLWAAPCSLHLPTEAWFARSGAWLAERPAPVVRKDWQKPATSLPIRQP